jgi:hypothetical protein
MSESYLKKVCSRCRLVIHSKEDEDEIKGLSGLTEHLHKDCLVDYEAEIKSERRQKAKGGRPPSITPEVKKKLEEAFAANCNSTEACLHAGICTKTLENYNKKHPQFIRRIEQLRSNPRRLAKMNQKKALDAGSQSTSEFVLKYTDDEYNPKQKQELTEQGSKRLIDIILAEKAKKEKGK